MSDNSRMAESDIVLIERLAEARGIKDEARRKWRERGRVPYRWRLPLIEDARAQGLNFDVAAFDHFIEAFPSPAGR